MNALPIVGAAVASPSHDLADHPEHAGRVPAILRAIEADEVAPGLAWLDDLTPASINQAARCHDRGYLAALEKAMDRAPGIVDPAPTYITPDSFCCALEAAGATIAVTREVVEGRAPAGLALVRPPGHHARPGAAMGFCLLGNLAIAAREAQAMGIGRVMIVDFDVHHGNGTQEIFYEDPSILFVSLHQAGIYPGTGFEEERGRGAGEGMTINVPLPLMAGDRAMLGAFERVVEPAAECYAPELVLVSAGFDAHFRDPLAGLQVTGEGYHAMTLRLMAMAERHAEDRLVFALEGGYDLEALGNGVVNVLRALEDRVADPSLGLPPRPEPEAKVDALLDRIVTGHDLA